MQFRNTDPPKQGSLPPEMTQEPRNEEGTRGHHHRLRHRCPFTCTRHHAHHTHTHTHANANHHQDSNPSASMDTEYRHVPSATQVNVTQVPPDQPYYYYPVPYHHYYYYPTNHQQDTGTSSVIVSRGVSSEYRVPAYPPSPQPAHGTPKPQHSPLGSVPPHAYIPQDFRKRVVRYMTKRLHCGTEIEVERVEEIEKRIATLEEQIHNSSSSQDEYITMLASRLAAILQHIDRCRPSVQPTQMNVHGQQQEPVT